MYVMRHQVMCIFFTYACLVGLLTSPLHAQGKGKPVTPARKLPSRPAPWQETITVSAKRGQLMKGQGLVLAWQNKDEKIAPASCKGLTPILCAHAQKGKIKLTDEVLLAKARETGGSKMFAELAPKYLLRRS
jgi:D-alanyl-D-alanine carboxypeptidase